MTTLKLFVDGASKADVIVDSTRRACQRIHGNESALEIVDVREHPELADDEHVLLIPTLICDDPPYRLFGTSIDEEAIVEALRSAGAGHRTPGGRRDREVGDHA